MDDTGIKENVINELKTLGIKHNIDKIILFGSRARGDFKRTSDIDIAVKGGDVKRFTLDAEEINTLLEFDIVDLNGPVQQELLEMVSAEGRILYEKV